MKVNITLCLLSICSCAFGQFIFTDSIRVENIDKMSIDRVGSVYLGDELGNVYKYNQNLQYESEFSPLRKGNISVLEAWNPLRIVVSYSDLQEVVYLDRFLVSENRFNLTIASSFVGIAAPSMDNNLWLVDFSKFSLIKYNQSFNQIEIERPFDLLLDPENYEITHIREYQNLLFISDKKSGILVFDNLGNYLYTIKALGIENFSFYGNSILFISKSYVHEIDLYTNKEKKWKAGSNLIMLVKNKEFYYLLGKKALFKAIKG
ncbi:NHL repeat-containing protein [Fulvivirga lutea]|uniref:Uncharacterized protein n=1 Tax=Fulvivirga lutea TaxID=2810512 RepID=A0A974WFE1_9BACT|nr:hypothetical protein [Fulvivirga lutea]QSE97453.1 hypothetical protein JR347_18025 [Fulvivirga lutea]